MGELHETLLLPKFVRDYSSVYDGLEETENGMYLGNVYIPEEIMLHIFTFVHPRDLLNGSLVCRNWNRLIKSFSFWSILYRQKYHDKPKRLPWYIFYCLFSTNYFDNNLIKNGNGQEGLSHWVISANACRDGWNVENPPLGADPLPSDVSEFYNCTSCFGTDYNPSKKNQTIKLENKLFQYILNVYKPYIYVSDWTASKLDWGGVSILKCMLVKHASLNAPQFIAAAEGIIIHHWKQSKWRKIEIRILSYPHDIDELVFEHGGSGPSHHGNKVAGGVLRFLFDSIEPLILDKDGRPKLPSSALVYETNGQKRQGKHLDYIFKWVKRF